MKMAVTVIDDNGGSGGDAEKEIHAENGKT
jgi:hypothetical protein